MTGGAFKKILCWVCLLYFSFSVFAYAQETNLERWLENYSAYSDPTDLLELLKEFEKRPINLNDATEEQLARFPLLNPIQARAIVQYRHKIGAFHSLADLSQIDLIEPTLVPILAKYLTVGSQRPVHQWALNFKSRFSRKISVSSEALDSATVVSPTKIYQRFDFTYGDKIRAGLLLEKDSGERKLDDLMLYFLSYHNRTTGHKLILGNYRLEFGQGLIFGNPYGYYKGSAANHWAIQRSRDLVEYALVDENASLYGVSAKLCFKIYQLFLFLSNNKLDASLNREGKIKNFYNTGLHRTPSEIAKKDQLLERLSGARLAVKPTANLALGTTFYRSTYSPPIAMRDNNLYRFALEGSSNLVLGADFQLTWTHFHWFGEFARSQRRATALISGVLFHIKPLELIVSYRNYSKQFINLHGHSFSEQGDYPQNERGIFWGLQLVPSSNLKLTFYFDQFSFPWRNYLISMPASGKDALLQAEYRLMKHVKLTTHYRFEQKDHQISETRQILPRIEHRGRTQLEVQIDDHVTLRGRLEKKWVAYRNLGPIPLSYAKKFNGLLLYQDILIRFRDNLHLATRLGWFDTDSYESRLYQFEHEVVGILTNQMLYGIGTRHYMRLLWEPYEFLHISAKLASTQYNLQTSTSSRSGKNIPESDIFMNFQIEIRW